MMTRQPFFQAPLIAFFGLWTAVSLGQYSVIAIPGLPGGYDMSFPSDLNDRGQVVGTAVSTTTDRAYTWINGQMTALATSNPDVRLAVARGINAGGEIVGSQQTETQARAVVWNADGIIDLGSIPPYISSTGDRINDRGDVVGRLPTATGADPFLWRNGSMQSLRELPGGEDFVHIADINNDGVLLGLSARTETSQRSLLWRDGVVTVLDDLPGGTGLDIPTGVWSVPSALNDLGEVVGVSDGENGIHAFLWRDGQIADLGALRNNWSEAADINNNSVVVGFTGTGDPHAFVWDSASGMRDLNDLLDSSGSNWILRKATAINSLGQIVGWGEVNGEQRGFLLTPIPEPQTLFTLCVGIAVAALRATPKLCRKRAIKALGTSRS